MNVEVASTLVKRLVGLHGRDSIEGALMLVPCNDIHTIGMRKPIDVAFVARDGLVLESHRAVRPNKRLKNRKAAATIERFSSEEAWYEPGDCVQHSLELAGRSQMPGDGLQRADTARKKKGSMKHENLSYLRELDL